MCFSFSPALAVDPSRTIGVVVCVVGALLSWADFPAPHNELYSISGTITYLSCVVMLTYTLVSTHRISYFIQADLIIIAVLAFVVSMSKPAPIKEKVN